MIQRATRNKFLFAVILLSFFAALSAHAATIQVDAANAVSDSGGCGTSGNPCNTINAGITNATAGDTLNIAAGTYTEDIVINKNITLLGVTPNSYSTTSDLLTPGVLTTILNASTTANPIIDITSTFTGITLKNLRLIGATGATNIRVSYNGDASNLTLENISTNGGLRGISYNNSTAPTVTGLTITGSAFRCGAATANGLEIWFVKSTFTITNNYIDGCRDGMNITTGHGGVTVPIQGTNVVSNNYIGAVGDSGIQVPSPFTSLSITGNTINLAGSLEVGNGEGIQVTSNGTATNVSITNNTITSGERAIVLETIAGSGSTVTVTGNTITGNSVVGVIVANTVSSSNVTGITFNNNVISGNTAGLQNNVSGTTLNAESNYWGSGTGPTHASNSGGAGDTSTDNADYTPWYIDLAKSILNTTISNGALTAADSVTVPAGASGEVSVYGGVTEISLPTGENLDLTNGVNAVSSNLITLAGSSKSLQNFSAGNISNIDISRLNAGSGLVSLEKGVQISSGTASTPLVIKNAAIPTIQLSLPDDTAILSSSVWDGKINPPSAVTPDTSSLGAYSVRNAYSFGSTNTTLIATKPLTIIIPSAGGAVGYQPAGSTEWHVMKSCAGTYDTPTNPAFPGECYTSTDTSTKIITYHLTTFAVLDAQTTVGGQRSSGSSGGSRRTQDVSISTVTPSVIFPSYTFTRTLKSGATGEDVKQLQSTLKALGVYPEGMITGFYGSLTSKAVSRLQEKYKDEVLTPSGLTRGTGFFGPATLKKLNSLLAQ